MDHMYILSSVDPLASKTPVGDQDRAEIRDVCKTHLPFNKSKSSQKKVKLNGN